MQSEENHFFFEVEYTRLRQVCQVNPRDAAIIELFLQTGIRLSELTGLTVRDITLTPISSSSSSGTPSTMRIQRGGGHVTISLNHKAQNALRQWLVTREPVLDIALFLTAASKGISKRTVQAMLKKYLTEAGIEGASVQTLRHTMAVAHPSRRLQIS